MSMIPCLFSLLLVASLPKTVITDTSVAVDKSQLVELAAIRSEMAMFESRGKRGRGLELVGLYRCLLSIPPLSVDTQKERFPSLASYARKCDRD